MSHQEVPGGSLRFAILSPPVSGILPLTFNDYRILRQILIKSINQNLKPLETLQRNQQIVEKLLIHRSWELHQKE
jgi:hypothetical protein